MLAPSLNGSSYLIPYTYAKILEKKHDVTIVGPTFGEGIFVNDNSVRVERLEPWISKPKSLGAFTLIPRNFARLLRNDFDVIFCFKLLPHTAPVSALAKFVLRKPLVITIDDYDKASPKSVLKRFVLGIADWFHRFADEKIVMSRFMQRTYGGHLIYQPIDTDRDRPTQKTADALRAKLGLEDKIVVTHVGTLFETKGIDVLIKAVQATGREDIKLVLFELGAETAKYKAMSGPETIWLKKRTGEKSLDYTLMADIYAIPTRDTLYTRAQTPAKIFEAMAMGRAIVASELGDISTILQNGEAGLLVRPNDVESLKYALMRLADDRALRERLGKNAKRVYDETYHHEKQAEKLIDLYDELEKRMNR